MLNVLSGIIETLATFCRAIIYVISGLIELIQLVIQSIALMGTFVNYLPVPLQVISAVLISVTAIYLILGRQH